MGSKGTKLAESERIVWFSWKRYCICTPHFNRKYEPILFRGRKTILPPNSGAQVCTPYPRVINNATAVPSDVQTNVRWTVHAVVDIMHAAAAGTPLDQDGTPIPGGLAAHLSRQTHPLWHRAPY